MNGSYLKREDEKVSKGQVKSKKEYTIGTDKIKAQTETKLENKFNLIVENGEVAELEGWLTWIYLSVFKSLIIWVEFEDNYSMYF